ncbi:DUF6773 family protein [Anoxybacterium hadale]|uniref:DUF6773 family protein n=1 Tax=Anoxybacterium hadale TaxID=3408580 RepID=UPI003AFF7E75
MKGNNRLDEMQEQKLLRIEHFGVWFAFWGLFAAIIIQLIIGGAGVLREIAGECIVFMLLAFYLLVACIKNGIWDRKLVPSLKTHLLISLAGGTATGIINVAASYHNYGKLYGAIAAGVFTMAFTFLLTLLALSFAAVIYRKRAAALERRGDENDLDKR